MNDDIISLWHIRAWHPARYRRRIACEYAADSGSSGDTALAGGTSLPYCLCDQYDNNGARNPGAALAADRAAAYRAADRHGPCCHGALYPPALSGKALLAD